MSSEPIELRLTIGDQVYTWTGVADPEDSWFAMKLGRAISEVVLEHPTTVGPVALCDWCGMPAYGTARTSPPMNAVKFSCGHHGVGFLVFGAELS